MKPFVAFAVALVLLIPGMSALHTPETQVLYDKNFFSGSPDHGGAQQILNLQYLENYEYSNSAKIKAQRVLDPRLAVKHGYDPVTGAPIETPYGKDDEAIVLLRKRASLVNVYDGGHRLRTAVDEEFEEQEISLSARSKIRNSRQQALMRWWMSRNRRPSWLKGSTVYAPMRSDDVMPQYSAKSAYQQRSIMKFMNAQQ